MDLAQPTAAQVGRLYDEATDLLVAAMGGNIHLGYWQDDQDSNPIELASDRLTDLVGAQLQLTYGQRVLDVGCGTGRPAARISAEYSAQVVGITISPHQVKLAQDAPSAGSGSAGSAEFVLADAMSELPFPDASFDTAYAIESLLHMSDQPAALTQISRVLRPKGRLVIADACLRAQPDDRAMSVMNRMGEQFQFASLLTQQDYQRLLANAGLVMDDYVDVGEHVRRSYGVTAQRVREVAGSLDAPQAAELIATAELLEQFGALPEIGYVLVTAVRH